MWCVDGVLSFCFDGFPCHAFLWYGGFENIAVVGWTGWGVEGTTSALSLVACRCLEGEEGGTKSADLVSESLSRREMPRQGVVCPVSCRRLEAFLRSLVHRNSLASSVL